MNKMTNFFLCLVAALAFTACSTCETCDCDGDVTEICQSDYDSKTQYDAIIALSESLGCECAP